MKLGLGLYKHMLTRDNFRFAKQVGCSHLIIHLADYYSQEKGVVTATDETSNYGTSIVSDPIWSLESMQGLQEMAREEGLEIFGIENFSPADWYDILLDGPKKYEQMEDLKQIIRNTGKAGIESFGYNFSFAGVWGHQRRTVARGGAVSACFNAHELAIDSPIPEGEIWNMTYGELTPGKFIEEIKVDILWDRFTWFLSEMLPVAEEAGVELALHPDDPPMERLRGTPRLVYQPHIYQEVIDLFDSESNKLEFCMGSVQEMSEGNLYKALESYASQGKISYAHVRNVKGKVPVYDEVFIDEGEIDMFEALRILKKHDFQGVLIPDHTPELLCDASWHAGMAYALGYIRAILQSLEKESH